MILRPILMLLDSIVTRWVNCNRFQHYETIWWYEDNLLFVFIHSSSRELIGKVSVSSSSRQYVYSLDFLLQSYFFFLSFRLFDPIWNELHIDGPFSTHPISLRQNKKLYDSFLAPSLGFLFTNGFIKRKKKRSQRKRTKEIDKQGVYINLYTSPRSCRETTLIIGLSCFRVRWVIFVGDFFLFLDCCWFLDGFWFMVLLWRFFGVGFRNLCWWYSRLVFRWI